MRLQKFCKLVDELLELHLAEIGIGVEDFVKLCSQARDASKLNRAVFEKLVAMEDFIGENRTCTVPIAWPPTMLFRYARRVQKDDGQAQSKTGAGSNDRHAGIRGCYWSC